MAPHGSADNDRLDLGQIDWFPQTLTVPSTGTSEARRSETHLQPSLSSISSRQPESVMVVVNPHDGAGSDQIFMDEKDRTVSRRLRGIHVFMITISGVLGVGLYLRSGSILRIGGPAAVLISFTAMGLLAWMVMQCIGEFLALWPVSGALVEFVGAFVDEDLGTTVGIAYWVSYCLNFAAVIVAAAGEVEMWNRSKAIQGTVILFLLPLFLILLNSFGVHIYGLTEVVGGSLKILGTLIVTVGMIVINAGGGAEGHIGTKYYRESSIFQYDERAAGNWATALFISLSIAAFAFIGVDITAATALEARPDRKRVPAEDPLNDELKRPWPLISVRFSATWTSFIAWIAYFVAGFVMTLNLQWDNDQLPQAGWLGRPSPKSDSPSDSGFVISAQKSGIKGLAELFNAILLITAITCANTNLYVASRTLFGLTRKIYGKQWRWLAFFGKTNSYQVPVRAMFLSCFFLWVPFLYLSPRNGPGTTIASLLEVLSQLGSVSCIIVWACECWAFIRFYNCMKLHQVELHNSPQFAHVCRFRRPGAPDYYPWRSHGQPLTMYLALAGCLFTLIVADSAALWHGFHAPLFFSAYLAPLCFLPLWLAIKAYRSGGWQNIRWELEDLSNIIEVKDKIRKLDELQERATARDNVRQKPGWGNLWGVI
ncbi:amino acid permease-domain-containing protein [Aspergillus alliaceus]|uniref:Amino acid permease-domain-containing protein n=1 Tax=Petromyces alliaceus TaxID=209559 RepID=A0A5N7C109_PETAA|nr:amino acid permease-domain-containing protein [Aspergillus alliaceus]